MKRGWILALALAPLAAVRAQEGDEVPEEERSGAAACLERARNETSLSEHESLVLCQGAESTEPVTCFLDASENTFMEPHEILTLCSPTLSGKVWSPE